MLRVRGRRARARKVVVLVGAMVASLLVASPSVAAGSVVINEIYYNPPDELPPGTPLDPDAEFLELHNPGDAPFDLSGMCFDGFTLCFAAGTSIGPGDYEIVAPSLAVALATHGVTPLAIFDAGGLSGGGETIRLIAADTTTVVDEVTYDDSLPWPVQPDGNGPSLELIDPSLDNDVASSWAASIDPSTNPYGTPGAQNSVFGSPLPDPVRNVAHTPAVPTDTDAVVVTAEMDLGTSADLTYKVMFVSHVVVPMLDDGLSGDGGAGDGVYGATIPPQSDGELVRYRIDITAGGSGGFPDPAGPLPNTGYVVADDDITTTSTPVFQWFLPPGTLEDILENHRFDDMEFLSVLHHDGFVIDNVTIRTRGGSNARSQPKVNWKFELPPGVEIDIPGELLTPVDEFNLQAEFKDKTFGRAFIAWEQTNAIGAPFLGNFWVRLELNGDFYGMYRFSERYDGTFRSRAGFDDGSFYKADGGAWDNPMKNFDKKEPDDGDNTEIADFEEFLTSPNGASKTAQLFDELDVPATINYTALVSVLRHYDSRGHNFYIDRDANGRWTILLWDLDQAYRVVGVRCTDDLDMITIECVDNVLTTAVMESPPLREMHLRRLRTLADELLLTGLPEDLYNDMLTTHADLISLEEAQWDRTVDVNRLLNDIDGLRDEIQQAIALGLLPPSQAPAPNIVINEIHYNPADGGVEFIELYNPNPTAVDISGWEIPAADLTAPLGTVILPDDYVVFTEDLAAFTALYGGGIFLGGQYGGGFSGGGELVELFDADGTLIDVVDYDDKDPWAETPDGDGPSLELIDHAVDNSLPNAWFPSSAFGGSPGTDNDPDTDGGPPPPPPPPPPVDVDYIGFDSVWRYLDDGSNQGTAWRALGFDDSSWFSGRAELGYGDGDETTTIDGGPAGNRFITNYFRRDFDVVDPARVISLDGRIVRDDGAVVYLNGTEIFRTNMPGGTIGYLTTASSTIGGSAESTPVPFTVDPSLLVPGTNTIAVEIHQRSSGSSDVSFDLELFGTEEVGDPDTEAPTSPDPVVATPTGAATMSVSWATATDDSGSVVYDVLRNGSQIATTASTSFDDAGLAPETTYSYVIVARDPSGNTTASSPALGTTDPDTTPPSDPTGLTAVATSSSQIVVSWNPSSDDVGPITYTVFQDGGFLATTTSTTVDADGLEPETEYEFSVQAADGAGNLSAVVGPVSETTRPDVVDPTLVARGSVWRYLDNGSDQGTAWREPGFDDSSWFAGRAQLGYGDGDETTQVDGGPSGNRHITTYFRQSFVADPAAFDALELSLLRDDGAVVYVNGVEVARSNMPGGPITSTTRASSTVGGSAEDVFNTFSVPSSVLVAGTNVIAVEIHQRGPSSSDISFDAGLVGVTAPEPGDLFVAEESVWTYLDNGTDQGTAWRELGFDDSTWFTGRAELGYGDGDETTQVDGGPSGNRHITTYFRHEFQVADASVYASVELRLKRDDGAVVYVNGTEVARSNMPGGTITFSTRASSTIGGSAEDAFTTFVIPTGVLQTGTNVIAVEIHQRGPSSSDISFDAALEGIR